MEQLEHLIDQWSQSLKASEPHLAPHLEEIKDHIRTDAQARMADGAVAADAFAAAIGAFGAPRELAVEFLKAAMPGTRLLMKYAAAYLVAVFAITAVVVLIDSYFALDVVWVGLGLTSLTILPVAAVPFYLERLYTERSAGVVTPP